METSHKFSKYNPSKALKALIIGGSGAVGREMIDLMVKSANYSLITIVTRRKIARWEKFSEEELRKVNFVHVESLDEILDFDKFPENYKKHFAEESYNTLFCCLGSRVNRGEAEFRKVDFNHVVNSAALANKLSINHFSVISSKGANSNSWFLYLKVKGQADDEILKTDIPCISVLRPGIILDRDNDSRLGEKIVRYVPFLDKITSKNLAEAIIKEDYYIHFNDIKQKKIYTHSEIAAFLDNMNGGCC